ncbi:Late embryogenesis abundant protein [Pseudoxanthomonas sp. GM95]|uniref:NDR1/HIN1-like protein n=1 Tax=Pseudoxanthomonas sp. GM95 TaxID=1881043 RepID=UPI0008AF8FE2|nr:LEA type 2 family protein [Pseudoxanthomonas sp. GM95]SEK81030.1 Late embryogenesis abundant protein [Pseudoxanthomonas sp. GM95]
MPRRLLLLLLCTVLLVACNRGNIKRVSAPAVSLQQVSVGTDGHWKVELRLQNYSTMSMVYDTVDLQVTVDGQPAGTLSSKPAFSIGPSFADVVTLDLAPSPTARMAVANALAGNGMLAYTLKGKIAVTPLDESPRSFDVDMHSTLSPAPGLAGVLR